MCYVMAPGSLDLPPAELFSDLYLLGPEMKEVRFADWKPESLWEWECELKMPEAKEPLSRASGLGPISLFPWTSPTP